MDESLQGEGGKYFCATTCFTGEGDCEAYNINNPDICQECNPEESYGVCQPCCRCWQDSDIFNQEVTMQLCIDVCAGFDGSSEWNDCD